MNQELQVNKLSQIFQKTWANPVFKQALLENPAAVLAAEGLLMPKGMELKVIENTATTFNLVVPANPGDTELNDTQLEDVSGGAILMLTVIGVIATTLLGMGAGVIGLSGAAIGFGIANSVSKSKSK